MYFSLEFILHYFPFILFLFFCPFIHFLPVYSIQGRAGAYPSSHWLTGRCSLGHKSIKRTFIHAGYQKQHQGPEVGAKTILLIKYCYPTNCNKISIYHILCMSSQSVPVFLDCFCVGFMEQRQTRQMHWKDQFPLVYECECCKSQHRCLGGQLPEDIAVPSGSR